MKSISMKWVAVLSLAAVGLVALVPAGAQAPVTPSSRSGGAAPAQGGAAQPAVPQVLRPSSTLGPGMPGQPAATSQGQPVWSPQGGPAVSGPGQSGQIQGGSVQGGQLQGGQGQSGQGGFAAGTAPRFPGMARFRSVGKADAVMFDAPSEKAKKIFVAPEGMPVEVVSVLRIWVKVRDPLGDLAWINRDDLSDRRMLIATAVSPLRREPQPMAPTWFSVDRGVVLELLDERPVNGFVKVKYVDGQIGYLQPGQVWGL